MKKYILLTILFTTLQTFAIVSEGKEQEVTVLKDKNEIYYIVNTQRFESLEECAKFCYALSAKPKSIWANIVNIKIINMNLSIEERQYIGDRFVMNKVYPSKIIMTYTYKSDGPLRKQKKKR